MTHHVSSTEEKRLRDWINRIRDDRITFPHGTPFESELQIIEKILNHKDEVEEEKPRASFVGGKDSFKNRK